MIRRHFELAQRAGGHQPLELLAKAIRVTAACADALSWVDSAIRPQLWNWMAATGRANRDSFGSPGRPLEVKVHQSI